MVGAQHHSRRDRGFGQRQRSGVLDQGRRGLRHGPDPGRERHQSQDRRGFGGPTSGLDCPGTVRRRILLRFRGPADRRTGGRGCQADGGPGFGAVPALGVV